MHAEKVRLIKERETYLARPHGKALDAAVEKRSWPTELAADAVTHISQFRWHTIGRVEHERKKGNWKTPSLSDDTETWFAPGTFSGWLIS